MTKFYTNLYKANPTDPSADYIYEGPHGPMHAGMLFALFATFTNTAADPFGGTAGDELYICNVPKNHKLVRFVALASTDMDAANDFTFDLGFSSDPSGMLAASAGLQATTAVELDLSDLIAVAPSESGDALILTRAAGSLEVAGTIRFFAEFAPAS